MDNNTKWKLIQRYVTGNSSPRDRRRLEHWMGLDPANEQLVRDARKIWGLTPEEDFDANVQEAWERFHHRKESRKQITIPSRSAQKRLRRVHYIFQAAAVLLVVLLAGFMVHYYAEEGNRMDEPARFYVMQNLTTERGEKAKVTFSDGTEVILNAASSLRFPQKFQGQKREVYLEGEAYFRVAHHPNQPFVVYAGDARVRVLGTEFNVRGWSDDARVDVAVRDGKVSVNAADASQPAREVVLTDNQFTSVRKGEAPAPVKGIDADDHLLWISGGLYFDNAPFKQVVRDIERKFDVHVTIADKTVLEVPFTGAFRNAKLQEVLQVTAASMELEYSHTESEVIFY